MKRALVSVLLAWVVAAVVTVAPAGGWAAAPKPRADIPINATADEITFDDELGLVAARGHVFMQQEQRTLSADTVTYNQKTQIVTADGNVVIHEPTGDVYFGDHVELTQDLADGFITALRLLMADKSRMAAVHGERFAGTRTVLDKGVFSPCDLCKDNPSHPPLWQIKAVKVIHNEETHDIEYKDAVLEIYGLPIAYLPYFSHPDPTVDRRSGFLSPRIANSTTLGTIFEMPYYYAISPQKDATFTPFYTSEQGPGMKGAFRQRFANGTFAFDGSVTEGDRTTNSGIAQLNAVRGHIRSDARFDIDDTYRWGYNLFRATDSTYLYRYDIFKGDTLKTDAFVEGFRGRNYLTAHAYAFQGQLSRDIGNQTPLVLPYIQYQAVSDPDSLGAYWTFDANTFSLSRAAGVNSRRMTFDTGWHVPYYGAWGDVVELAMRMQTDVFSVQDQADRTNPTRKPFNGLLGRAFPQLTAKWSLPMVRDVPTAREIVEPIIAVIAGPNGGNKLAFPNEDSLSFEYDDGDLFSNRRFSGYDRVDSGQRVDYGVRLGYLANGGGGINSYVGQSYRFREQSEFLPGSGLNDNRSDVVGLVEFTSARYIDIDYHFRLDSRTLAPRRNEAVLSAGPQALRLGLNYIFIDDTSLAGGFGKREQLVYSATSQATQYWSVSGALTQSIGDNVSDSRGYTVRAVYQDECLTLMPSFRRSFVTQRDIKPTTSFQLQFFFKHLGGNFPTGR